MLRDIPFNRMKGISFFYSKGGGLIMDEIKNKVEREKLITGVIKNCSIDN